ncbi:MAG: twin-arginine translocation signal domain-containing protein, partial [Roseiflexaceae bacterium]
MGTQPEKPAVSRRKFLQGMAGLAGASLLAACGGATTPTGGEAAPTAAGAAAPATGGTAQATVEWWDSQTGVDEEITKTMIDTFQQKNP